MKQQQKVRLNAHKTALHDDRFFPAVQSYTSILRLMYDERENESFLYTRSNIFNSRKLNFVHYIFMCSAKLAFSSFLAGITNFCPSYNKYRNFRSMYDSHTFISFPSLELLRCAMKNMKMFSSFFFFFPFSSFHAKIVFL